MEARSPVIERERGVGGVRSPGVERAGRSPVLDGVRRGGMGGRGDLDGDEGPLEFDRAGSFALGLVGLGPPIGPRPLAAKVGEAMFRDMLRGLRVRESGGAGDWEIGGSGCAGGGWVIVIVVVPDDCAPPLPLPDEPTGAGAMPNMPVMEEFGLGALGPCELNIPGGWEAMRGKNVDGWGEDD